jgi:predicted metal-dependent hydrolase
MISDLQRLEVVRGADLINRGQYFAAHEVLEEAWRSTPLGLPERRHLQGIVQLAVALHHESVGNFAGARSVLERAIGNLHGAEVSLASLDVERLQTSLVEWQRYLAGAAERPAAILLAWNARRA